MYLNLKVAQAFVVLWFGSYDGKKKLQEMSFTSLKQLKIKLLFSELDNKLFA